MGLIDGAIDTGVDVGERVIDVPADAVNATTGTGENLGWFGTIDRKLDPRSAYIEEDEWAEPSSETDGLGAGLIAGKNALSEGAGQVGGIATDPLMSFVGFGGDNNVPDRQSGEDVNFADDPYQDSESDSDGLPVDPVMVVGLLVLIALFVGVMN